MTAGRGVTGFDRVDRGLDEALEDVADLAVENGVLGSLAGIPPEAFADIDPNPDNARIIRNLVMKNGSKPPTLPIPLPGVDFLWDGSGVNNCWMSNIFNTSFPSPLPKCN